MTRTTSHLPICIHCGTARPADETLCPKCGKPWIDVRIAAPPPQPPAQAAPPHDPVAGAALAATAATQAETQVEPVAVAPSHDTGEFGMDEWTLPPDPPKSRAIWLIPIGLLLAVLAFWSFVYFGSSSTTTTLEVAATSTTTTTTTTTTLAVVVETTTSTSTTTTTTVPWPAASEWAAQGDAIPTTELALKAAGIGPINFGDKLGDVAGLLVASLGPAETAGDSGGCQPDEAYWLQWGPLKAIFDGYGPDASFVSYRYEETEDGSQSVILRTLSGLELGHTVSQLQATYTSYTVTFEVIDGQDHFRLVDGGNLLLWGPVTSTDASGTVQGIYSPSPCPSI